MNGLATVCGQHFQVPDHLDVYDICDASQDVQLSVTTMTGVINRQQPKVYLLSNDDAAFWLKEVLRRYLTMFLQRWVMMLSMHCSTAMVVTSEV